MNKSSALRNFVCLFFHLNVIFDGAFIQLSCLNIITCNNAFKKGSSFCLIVFNKNTHWSRL